ncbi:DUF1499 domain-containing protein [Tepidicaulis sp. LMO-SS28]|uniref:DUF1499 domain-containing protein n=1 Tax=Tepidicaulis sp. LMO-SS28 TaxID=3447455 RepID=UPI003EE4062A
MTERSGFARWSFRLALLAAVVAVLAVLGHRLGVMDFRLAIFGLLGGALIGLAAVLTGIAGVLVTLMGRKSGTVFAAAGLVIGAIVAAPVLMAMQTGAEVPRIHDISTDLQDPPQFVAVRAVRTPQHNSLERSEPENLAELQREGYPDLAPATIDRHPGLVFEEAVALVKDRGWEIVSVSPEAGTIEATDTTRIMGFKDDVVIRVREGEEGRAVVDMRSVSRVGIGDMGTNAKRIKAFLSDLEKAG